MGPCLCGDVYCPSCGNPGLAAIEAAADTMLERFSKAGLTPQEYEIVTNHGLALIETVRAAAASASKEILALQAEANAMRDWPDDY